MHSEKGLKRRKRKEESIARTLTRAGIDFKREHRVSFDCFGETWAFVDFIIIIEGRVVVLEVDEFQHAYSNYTVGCDLRRIMAIVEAWRSDCCDLPITVIRWNPDIFTVDGVLRKVKVTDKQQRLIAFLREMNGDRPDFEIVYMFYDVIDGVPTILQDPDFSDTMKTFCSDALY